MTTLHTVTGSGRKPAATPKPRRATQKDNELGQKIRLRRAELGISQSDLAAQLEVTFQQVQKYEKGVNRVSASRLQQIASALNVPVTFFYAKQTVASKEVESLLFLDSNFALRILRAYSSIKSQDVQRKFVLLLEGIAESQGG